jgi:hypothetical protein
MGNNDWIASPTNKRKRICAKCRQPRSKQGHDPCIANLPGVLDACCGHGVGDGYIMFVDGRIIRGPFTVELDMVPTIEERFQEFHGLGPEIKTPQQLVERLAREHGIGGLEKFVAYIERHRGDDPAGVLTQTVIDTGRNYIFNHQSERRVNYA